MNNNLGRTLKVGTVLNDKWVILEFVGKGAMGEVYRAHQLNLKRDTAIKVISPEWLESFDGDEDEIETTLQRFRREVQAMAPVRHPNVLQIFDYDSTSVKDGDQELVIEYIAMEYVPGNTLRSTMSEDGFYPDENATRAWLIDYFLPILGGVRSMHEVGIIHRDLKPENVLLDGYTPKIADFGLARSCRFKSVTQSVDSKGTPPYMSPEQFLDFKRADEKADIYSLGKMLYEAIEGKMTPKTLVPFQCASLKKTETPFFERLNQVICDATAEDKKQRLESVRLFRDRIMEAVGIVSEETRAKTTLEFHPEPGAVQGVDVQPGAGSPEVSEQGVRRRSWFWKTLTATGVVMLATAAAFVWKLYFRGSPPPKADSEREMTMLPSGPSLEHQAVRSPHQELRPVASQTPEGAGFKASGSLTGEAEDLIVERSPVSEPGLFPRVEEHPPSLDRQGVPSPETLETRKGRMQDRAGGLPERILMRQSIDRVEPPTMDAAVVAALTAAQSAAKPLIDTRFHKGRRRVVPDDFKTIQGAIDAARGGDVVLVKPGTYFESIVMKDGVKLVSDSAHGGDKLLPVEGGQLKLPARTLYTIIDGSRAKGSSYWIIDFSPGAGRNTIVDGFTIENLPVQDQHILSSAHAINIRGASPVIMNSYIRKNGGMGIGNHVSYKSVEVKGSKARRGFQETDVEKTTEPVIFCNVICQNLGPGIWCDHFSAPAILGNELFLNVFPYSSELGEKPSPGIGTNHGAMPTITGNIVHDQPGGGILCDTGKLQAPDSAHGLKVPSVEQNVVYRNGEHGPSILCSGGTREAPIRCAGNCVYDAGWIGIDLSKDSVCIVEDNMVSGACAPGIRVDGAIVVRLNRNKVTGANAPGFLIKNGGKVLEMIANVSDLNKGPRFVLQNATIIDPDV